MASIRQEVGEGPGCVKYDIHKSPEDTGRQGGYVRKTELNAFLLSSTFGFINVTSSLARGRLSGSYIFRVHDHHEANQRMYGIGKVVQQKGVLQTVK